LLQQAKDQRDRFADVQVGVSCSRCGQLVDEAHAQTEHARLAHEIETREAAVERLGATTTACEEAETAARKRRISLHKDKTACDKHSAELAATSANLTQLGGVADAVELRARLAEQL